MGPLFQAPSCGSTVSRTSAFFPPEARGTTALRLTAYCESQKFPYQYTMVFSQGGLFNPMMLYLSSHRAFPTGSGPFPWFPWLSGLVIGVACHPWVPSGIAGYGYRLLHTHVVHYCVCLFPCVFGGGGIAGIIVSSQSI